MAQTGFTPIQLYSSSTPTNAPSAGNLTNDTKGSELAINIADKNLFFKDSTNAVNTVPIRQSGAASDGWLSSTDWNTFNSKQPAGTYVNSVTGTAPVVSSGGTNPAISMAAATTSVNGYLTSTDWNTFNNKQAALVSGTNIKTVSGATLLGSGDLGTIGTAYGGTGLTSFTSNGVVYASSTSALATGSGFTFDGTNLALGTTISPWGSNFRGFEIGGRGAVSYNSGGANVFFSLNSYATNSNNIYKANTFATLYAQSGGQHQFYTAPSGTAGNNITFTQVATIFNTGGVSIGNTTDPGAGNLSVTGAVNAKTAFRETNGASGNIANGATFTITIPSVRRPQLLTLYSDYNLFQGWYGLIKGDGAGNAQTNAIVNNGGMTVAGTAASTITVTNNFGGTANIRWSLLPLGVAL
jgi:hypothetical protein